MHFMLRNGPTSKLLGSCYVLDSSTGYEGQPPTQSTTLLGKVRSSYEIFPFSLYFFFTAQRQRNCWDGLQGVTVRSCSMVCHRAAAVVPLWALLCQPSCRTAPKPATGSWFQWEKCTGERACLEENIISSWLTAPLLFAGEQDITPRSISVARSLVAHSTSCVSCLF